MRRVAVVAIVAGLGCLPYYESPRPQPEPQATPRPPLADRLAELADTIDPGPQPPLTSGLAPWVAAALGVPAKPPEDLLFQISQPLQRWDTLRPGTSEAETIDAIVALARAVALAEPHQGKDDVDVEVLLMLERAYGIFDRPEFAQQPELVARFLGVFAKHAQEQGVLTDQRQVAELIGIVRAALNNAGPLHRRTVARILRLAPEHPDIPAILQRAARGAGRRNDELAVGAMRLSVELREPKAEPAHYLELAATCYQALELACGNEALQWAQAGRASAGLRGRFAYVDRIAKLVAEAGTLVDRADIEARVRRGEIMLELRRWDDAEQLYRSLHRQHPKDARAVTGLAKHAIASAADFHAAYQLIERSEATEHRDRAYFEVAIGTRATTLVQDVLPRAGSIEEAIDLGRPYVDKLRADVVAYEELGADDGVVLHFVLDRLEEAATLVREGKSAEIRARARGLLPAAVALHKKVPTNAHAYRIALSAASLSSDAKGAFAVVDAPVPKLEAGAASQAALRRAAALLDLSIAWEKWGRLDDVLAYAEASKVAKNDPRLVALRAHVAAIRARVTGDAEAWIRAEEFYRTAAGDPEAPAVVLHDLGVVLHELGKPGKATKWWQRALERIGDDRRDIVRLHEVVGSKSPTFVAIEPFTESSDEDLALVALRWAARAAAGADAKRVRKALAKAEAAAHRATKRPSIPPGRAGVLLKGSLSFNLGYRTSAGLELVLDVVSTPWLVLSPT